MAATLEVEREHLDQYRCLTSIPIGPPSPTCAVTSWIGMMSPEPIGVPGELYIAGDGLAAGYLKRPGLTAEKFIPNPFAHGTRMYKTGDWAKWLPDGTIEFLGRLDHQVKIRGLRIELGEIEAALAQHPTVHENAVLVREDAAAEKRLVAWIIPTSEVAFVESDVRQFLKERLPYYMVPSAFVVVDAFPLMPNGKLDRSALVEPILQAKVPAAHGHAEARRIQRFFDWVAHGRASPRSTSARRSLCRRRRANQGGGNMISAFVPARRGHRPARSRFRRATRNRGAAWSRKARSLGATTRLSG